MSGLEPTYTNIIKQELEIGDLRRALALVTGKLERLQQFVDRSEWGQERDRLTARITELERDIEGCHRSNAALLVCGAENCEPYRDLQSQLVTLEQRAQEDRIIMALGGDQTEWYARQLATAQARIEELERGNITLTKGWPDFRSIQQKNDTLKAQLATVTQQYTAAIRHIEELVTTPRAAQLLSKLIQAERDIESLQHCQCDGCEECLDGDAYCLRCVVKLREQITALQHENALLATQRPPEPTRSACGHYDCNEEDCYGK